MCSKADDSYSIYASILAVKYYLSSCLFFSPSVIDCFSIRIWFYRLKPLTLKGQSFLSYSQDSVRDNLTGTRMRVFEKMGAIKMATEPDSYMVFHRDTSTLQMYFNGHLEEFACVKSWRDTVGGFVDLNC